MNSALCIFSLFLASSLILSPAESAANDIVEDTCKKIASSEPEVKYDYCMESLGSDPKSHTADARGLGLIALNLLENNLMSTLPYIEKLLQQKWDQHVKKCLMDCSDLYLDLAEDMKYAVGLYQAKVTRRLSTMWLAIASSSATRIFFFNEFTTFGLRR